MKRPLRANVNAPMWRTQASQMRHYGMSPIVLVVSISHVASQCIVNVQRQHSPSMYFTSINVLLDQSLSCTMKQQCRRLYQPASCSEPLITSLPCQVMELKLISSERRKSLSDVLCRVPEYVFLFIIPIKSLSLALSYQALMSRCRPVFRTYNVAAMLSLSSS